jgi:hypothetical protein
LTVGALRSCYHRHPPVHRPSTARARKRGPRATRPPPASSASRRAASPARPRLLFSDRPRTVPASPQPPPRIPWGARPRRCRTPPRVPRLRSCRSVPRLSVEAHSSPPLTPTPQHGPGSGRPAHRVTLPCVVVVAPPALGRLTLPGASACLPGARGWAR